MFTEWLVPHGLMAQNSPRDMLRQKKEVKENKKSSINIYAKPLPKSAEVIKLE